MTEEPTGTEHVPLGEGVVVVRLRLSPGEAIVVRGMLAGHDHLASPHASSSDVLALVTTTDRESELRTWVDELVVEMPSIEVLP